MVSEHASPLATLGGVDAGGQNVHVAALALAIARFGNSVTVYTRRDDPLLPKRVMMAPNVFVEHVDAGPAEHISKDELLPFMDAFAAALHRAWNDDPPDVVHSHFWMSGKASIAAARVLGIPVVHTFHALGIEKRRQQGAKDTSPSTRLDEERAIVAAADRVVATSSSEIFELMRMGADPRQLKIVPCGVDVDVFTPYGVVEKRTTNRQRVVTLSRLVPRKGIGDVIEAVALLDDVELVIAGGGEKPELASDPEAQRLLALARKLGIDGRVEFRGRLERWEIPELLRSADIVACTPWYEPFGIVPLEAMACGKPVVVSAVGGLIDTVVDRITGMHVRPKSPPDIAEALGDLLADAKRRSVLGAMGVERVRTRYTWPRIAADTLEIYRGVAGGSSAVAQAMQTS
jgi:glycosyltransferase involved in cell wall biosynthesis